MDQPVVDRATEERLEALGLPVQQSARVVPLQNPNNWDSWVYDHGRAAKASPVVPEYDVRSKLSERTAR